MLAPTLLLAIALSIFAVVTQANPVPDPGDPNVPHGPQPTAGPSRNTCNVTYKFVLSKFYVHGANWPYPDFEHVNSALRRQLEGCGAITHWRFDVTPGDPDWQWYAHGNLPVGTSHCVARAVITAGGTNTGKC
ncbi:hypothetical protein MMC28_010568 [Mycoblastus sanguinarius]|nr:hypothetical protein [Mycoblastus sanguinarius]